MWQGRELICAHARITYTYVSVRVYMYTRLYSRDNGVNEVPREKESSEIVLYRLPGVCVCGVQFENFSVGAVNSGYNAVVAVIRGNHGVWGKSQVYGWYMFF